MLVAIPPEFLDNKMSNIVTLNSDTLPDHVNNLVSSRLPAISAKTSPISRSNSQTTLTMMTLTMMSGQSPLRQVRQILAEIDRKKSALAEAQVSYAKLKCKEIAGDGEVADAERRLNGYHLQALEVSLENAIKDIATLISAYDALVANHGIENWTEEDMERAEAKHHVRRGFELLYRNIIECGRARESSIEYLQQFGVHVQVALAEVSGYIVSIDELIRNGGRPSASSIEDFLDEMASKYEACVSEASMRMFGRADTVNPDMLSVRTEA